MPTIGSAMPVALDVDGGIARLRLNRPEVSNGLNVELLKALHEAVLTCHADPTVRIVLLTGEGRNFCAGGDIHTFESKGAGLPDYLREVHKVLGADLTKFNGEDSWTLPMPARYVIAQDGTIAYAEVNADYTRRPEPSAILPVLEQLGRRQVA